MNDWFAAHPEAEALWTEQERKHAECKSAKRQGRQASLEFPTWEAFSGHVDWQGVADHVDRVVKEDAVQRRNLRSLMLLRMHHAAAE